MGWVDRVPRAGNLFIGGLYALYQPNAVKEAGITHVLSVIDFDVFQRKEAATFLQSKNYEHLNINIDDAPNEDLLQYFKQMTDFIDNGLSSGGSVYVHCAMGKSRSATAVTAYLMRKYGYDRDTALAQLCEGRPVCFPNPGFMEQLAVWEKVLKTDSEDEAKAIYNDWQQNRFIGDWSEWERRDPRLRAKL
ncbi:hypothetical protein AMS68_005129 [Peltaster fructicola]|uniref:protein-tyrosine-phosphatase n=1 Tax=Peltaster fructicola TaxID=286661 RepID=A0A6H0XXW6_9PEZI|nr:hypothetical protein AMS68_005129 [Peltaster fructicola]